VNENFFNEGNQIHNFISSSGSGTLINYSSGSDLLTNYGSGSTSQKVTVPTVPVLQHWMGDGRIFLKTRRDTPLPSIKIYQMSLISTGSISLDSTFKEVQKSIKRPI
jgi:hypothetical protein